MDRECLSLYIYNMYSDPKVDRIYIKLEGKGIYVEFWPDQKLKVIEIYRPN